MKKVKNVKNNKGFSLVELIVVIAIMAVLVGVLAPQFIKYVEKSKEATDIQNISYAASALQTYFADHECSADVTVTLGSAATGDGEKALANAGLDATLPLKGTWTTAPSVTYKKGSTAVEYGGESSYYKVNSNNNGYDAQ